MRKNVVDAKPFKFDYESEQNGISHHRYAT
jgi:hypothetical protein